MIGNEEHLGYCEVSCAKGNVMVRLAINDDIPSLVNLGRSFHSQMIYNDHHFNDEFFASTIESYIDSDIADVWIGKDAMSAAVISNHLATGHRMASEIFLYSESANQGLRLLKAMKDWAKQKDATQLVLTDQMNMKNLSKLYERVGGKPIERVYLAEVN